MNSYLPAVFSRYVRIRSTDRSIKCLKKRCALLELREGHGFQRATHGKMPMVFTSKWRCRAGSRRMWL